MMKKMFSFIHTKAAKAFCVLLFVIAFGFLLYTAGASDAASTDTDSVIQNCVWSCVMMSAASAGIKYCRMTENRRSKRALRLKRKQARIIELKRPA